MDSSELAHRRFGTHNFPTSLHHHSKTTTTPSTNAANMIDQTTISPTTSVNGEVKPSPVQEIRIDEQQQLVPEEARDMIEMLEQANEELRVLMEDDGLEEVKLSPNSRIKVYHQMNGTTMMMMMMIPQPIRRPPITLTRLKKLLAM